MDNRILIGAITAVVVVVMLGSVLMPVIDDATTGKSESNPDAGWIRMNYDTAAGSTYTVTITPGDDGITVANGSDTQTGSDDTIFYADSNVAVWMQDGTVNILGQNTDGPQFLQPEEAITVTRTAEGVTVASGGDSLSFAAPAWAYVPFSSGSYGYFTDGTAVKTNSPMAAVGGGFAGVYAYNDITRYAGLGLQLQTVTEDGKLTGAYWAKPAAADSLSITPFDPGSITIQPLDPGVISLDPQPDVSIMSVPTPTYTDGVWGYDVASYSGVQKAIIVSYSGEGGDIVVPSTVGGYPVIRFGKQSPAGTMQNQVFDNSSIAAGSTLTISDGIEEIGGMACKGVTKLVSLKLPNTLLELGAQAFNGCTGLTGSLVIPDSVTRIYDYAFYGCTGLTGSLVIPGSVTTLGTFSSSSFYAVVLSSDALPTNDTFSMSTLTEFLNLSNTTYTVGNNGIPATATIQDNIGDSAGYITFVQIGSDAPLNEGAKQILVAVPVLVIFSLIVAALVIFLKRSY